MKIKHKAKLHAAIEKWLDETGEGDGHPQYVHGELADDMLKAAEAVYDACMKGQDFYEQEKRS